MQPRPEGEAHPLRLTIHMGRQGEGTQPLLLGTCSPAECQEKSLEGTVPPQRPETSFPADYLLQCCNVSTFKRTSASLLFMPRHLSGSNCLN